MTSVVYPHWHVLGAGAIGCLWSAQLFRSQIPCTLLLRPKRLDSAAGQTLKITEANQTELLDVPLESTDAKTPIQNLLLTTKAADALTAVQSVKSRLAPNATILLLQNGMGSQQQIAEEFSDFPVYAGTTTDGAWIKGFLSIHRAGRGKTWLGPLNATACKQTQNSGITCLTRMTNMDISLTDNILLKLQEKVAINAAINGMTALHNCPNGDLLKPEHQTFVASLCRETAQVLSEDGYTVSGQQLFEAANHVATITAENFSSSLQDVRQNRRTELQWINGYLLSRAQVHGLEAPTHKHLMEQLAAKDIY